MGRKIFTYYMILAVIGISITSFFTSELTHRYYTREVQNKLENTALIIRHNLGEKIGNGEHLNFDREAGNYSKLLNESFPDKTKTTSRITFIDYEGKVLGESDTDYHGMENHLNRKEIQAAIKGNLGRDIRHSNTLDVDFLYIAIPMPENKTVVRVSVPLVQLKQIDKTIWLYALSGIGAALLLTALLALRFTAYILRPVKELIKVSKEIANGNYSKRASIQTKDELGELSDTFNGMAYQLEKNVADLTEKNVRMDSILNSMVSGLVAVDSKNRIILINTIACKLFKVEGNTGIIGKNILEVIRNHQINSFLRETIEKNTPLVNEITLSAPAEKILRVYTAPIKATDGFSDNAGSIATLQDITNIRKLEQIRTEFVSNVTHELKTPLTSIRGFIETLRSGAAEDREVAHKFLEIIDIEAERLYMLINDILQLSEIESNKKDTNLARHRLKSITDEVISILQGSAEKKGVSVTKNVPNDIDVLVNRDRFKQMFINLIDNAIKYNIENGTVTVEATRYGGKLVIRIKDTGIGIPLEHQSRIFERFYRVDRGRSRNMGGTGLGLSIVKHIVNLYNGDIRLISSPGKGTEFLLQFPL